MNAQTQTLPPMTRAQWEALPEAVKRFHPWQRASQPLTVQPKPWKQANPEGYKYFTEAPLSSHQP